MKKTVVVLASLLVLTGCGASTEESDDFEELPENTEPISRFHVEDVPLPDGSTVTCVAYQDTFVCDWG